MADYCPDWWPASTRPLIRRVRLQPTQISADPRAWRRAAPLHPDQRALPIAELTMLAAVSELPDTLLEEALRPALDAHVLVVRGSGYALHHGCTAATLKYSPLPTATTDAGH